MGYWLEVPHHDANTAYGYDVNDQRGVGSWILRTNHDGESDDNGDDHYQTLSLHNKYTNKIQNFVPFLFIYGPQAVNISDSLAVLQLVWVVLVSEDINC